MNMRKICFVAIAYTFSIFSYAGVVDNVSITRLYTQSVNGENDSSAHAIEIDKPVENNCNYRLHIDKEDTALFSTILAYKLSGTQFNLMYAVVVTPKTLAGHLVSRCKIFSIY